MLECKVIKINQYKNHCRAYLNNDFKGEYLNSFNAIKSIVLGLYANELSPNRVFLTIEDIALSLKELDFAVFVYGNDWVLFREKRQHEIYS